MKLSELIAEQNQFFSPFRRWLERAQGYFGDIDLPVSEKELKRKYVEGWHPRRIEEL